MSELRTAIIAEMKSNESLCDSSFRYYCTWWFKHRTPYTNKECRKELDKMLKEGIVTADKSEKNNTKWTLVK